MWALAFQDSTGTGRLWPVQIIVHDGYLVTNKWDNDDLPIKLWDENLPNVLQQRVPGVPEREIYLGDQWYTDAKKMSTFVQETKKQARKDGITCIP